VSLPLHAVMASRGILLLLQIHLADNVEELGLELDYTTGTQFSLPSITAAHSSSTHSWRRTLSGSKQQFTAGSSCVIAVVIQG